MLQDTVKNYQGNLNVHNEYYPAECGVYLNMFQLLLKNGVPGGYTVFEI